MKHIIKESQIILRYIIIDIILVWVIWGNITIDITKYIVSSDRLPLIFNHYKIAVISDLHNAEIGINNVELINIIKKEEPDMIAITGDFIDSDNSDLEAHIKLAQNFAKICPCYYVPGNHETLLGRHYPEFEKKLRGAGIVILNDRAVYLTEGDCKMQLAGLYDPDFINHETSEQEGILRTKLQEMNLTKDYCILLSHRPEVFNAYVSENIDLALCGHAHGGQFRLPYIGGVIAPNQGFFPKYDAGYFSVKNTTMILSRGIGNSNVPVRINNCPEMVIVELRHGKTNDSGGRKRPAAVNRARTWR